MKRTTRRRLVIWGINLLVVALIALVVLVADWSTIRQNFWNPGGVSPEIGRAHV